MPVRTLVLVALVPLVAFTIFVIVTHRERPPPAPPAPAPTTAQSPGVIFVTPVSAPPTSSR